MDRIRQNAIITLRIAGIYGPMMGRAIREVKRKTESDTLHLDFAQDTMTNWRPSLDLIRDGKLDVAIEAYSPLLNLDGLRSTPLIQEDAYILLSADNPLAKQESFAIDDLGKIRFKYAKSNVHYAYVEHLRWLCRNALSQDASAKSIVLSNTETIRGVIFNGLDDCAIMLPESMAKRYSDGEYSDFVRRPFVGEGTRYDMRAFYQERPSDDVSCFVEVLKNELG